MEKTARDKAKFSNSVSPKPAVTTSRSHPARPSPSLAPHLSNSFPNKSLLWLRSQGLESFFYPPFPLTPRRQSTCKCYQFHAERIFGLRLVQPPTTPHSRLVSPLVLTAAVAYATLSSWPPVSPLHNLQRNPVEPLSQMMFLCLKPSYSEQKPSFR